LAFVGTNVDNTVVTMAMVAGAPAPRAHRIAAGQVLGFVVLVVASAAAAILLAEFSTAVVGLLGLVPLAIGLHGLLSVIRSRRGATGAEGPSERTGRRAVGQSLTAAALVTIAAGGDNLAVYIPLLRNAVGWGLLAVAVVFAAGELLVTWLVLTGGRHPHARTVMTRLGAMAVPVLLCCVGLLVMFQAGTFSLL